MTNRHIQIWSVTIANGESNSLTALKTISMRIRGMDEDTGEATDDLKDLSKTIKGITGVSVFTDETNQTYKSTYDILQQISGVYDTLSDKSQAEVLELIAGKRQGNVVSSMLTNFTSAEKALEVQAGSTGGALREQATYMDSIVAHVNTLKETFVGLGQSLVKSDLVKYIVDIGTAGVSGFKGLIDTLGTIPTLAGAASIALSAMRKQQIFGNQNGSFSFLGKTVEEMRQATAEGQKFGGLFARQISQPLSEAESYFSKYSNAVSIGKKATTEFIDSVDDVGMKSYLKNLGTAPATMETYSASLKTAKVSTIGMTVATTAMNMAMTMGIAALVSLAVAGISKLITYQQDCINKANELTSTYKEQQKTITDNISTIQGLNGEFETLSKGVDDYGNNIALSAEEYKRYQEIVSQILGISPELITGYDKEGKAIADKNNLIERSIESLKEEQRLKLLDMTTEDKNWTKAQGSMSTLANATNNTNAEQNFNKIFTLNSKQDKMASSVLGTDTVVGNYQEIANNIESIIAKSQDKTSEYYKTLTDDEINNLRNWSQEYIRKLKDVEDARKGFNSQLLLNAQSTDSYSSLNDSQKNLVSNYANSFKINPDINSDGNIDWTEQLQYKDDIVEMTNDVKNFVDTVANASDESKANINSLFSLDKSKMSAGEYQKQADVLIDIIAKEFEMNPVDLKVQLGMDSVDKLIDEAKKKVNTAEINSAYTSQQASDKSSFVEGLSEDDLKILVKMGDIGSMSIEEITKAIDNAKKATGDLEDQTVKSADELEKEYEKANKAVSDFSSNASSIATVMKTISDGEKVDANTLLDLIAKYPQYASEILKVNDSKEQGLEIAKLLFEANKAQTLTELENYGKLLKAQEDLLATKVEYSNQPLEANTAWVEAHTKSQANDTSIDVVKGSNFEDFQKKDTGKKSDPNQDAYEKAMANHIHLHNMQLESDTDFYNAMEQANETYYKNDVDHLKDYNTNIETIYNGRNDIIKQAFEDEKTILQDANSGSIADQKKYLETLSKLNDEYYKGKTQFGKEYIATQKEIAKGQADLIKQENESQMDFVSSLKDKFDKDADDKLNALKKQNEEVDKQLEKQQHLLDLQEKEIALKHAEENSRMVVGDNGIEYRTNPDDIKNAELDVAKAKQVIEQDKTDDQISALESVKENGDAIYDVLLEMYKALTGKDVTPVKSNPEVEARLAQATTIDKDGNTLVNGMPITPLIETKTPFDINALSAFNQGNFNMSNILGDTSSRLGELGAVTNNSTNNNQGFSLNIENINVSDVATGTDIRDVVINQFPNSMRQAFGSNIRK